MGLAYAPAFRGRRLWSAALRGQTASLLPGGNTRRLRAMFSCYCEHTRGLWAASKEKICTNERNRLE